MSMLGTSLQAWSQDQAEADKGAPELQVPEGRNFLEQVNVTGSCMCMGLIAALFAPAGIP